MSFTTETSFDEMPHTTRRVPTLQELLTILAKPMTNVFSLSGAWMKILQMSFHEPKYTVRVSSAEGADILPDCHALMLTVWDNTLDNPRPVFYLLVLIDGYAGDRFFEQEPNENIDAGLRALNPVLRTLRTLIHKDHDPHRENNFVWCATAAGCKIRVWRHSVFGADDQYDDYQEPKLHAEFRVRPLWQGARPVVKVADGEWVEKQTVEMDGKVTVAKVFEQWYSYKEKRCGATHRRYMGCELVGRMHEVERLWRPYRHLGRYRVLRAASCNIVRLGTNVDEDKAFLESTFLSVKRQGARLAQGDHVREADANGYLGTFFLADVFE
jgi:hypothetical protein